MGRVKKWLEDMQYDAAEMTSQEFVDKHGGDNIDIWIEMQWKLGHRADDEIMLAISKPVGEA